MPSFHERINDDLPAREVDRSLTQEFGVSLFRFARALAAAVKVSASFKRQICSARQPAELRKIARDWEKSGIRAFHEIKRLSTSHLEKARGGIPLMVLPSQLGGDRSEDLKYLGLNRIIDMANRAADQLEKRCQHRRGSYIDIRSIVAASWGNLLTRHKRMKWIHLADLYDWFWARLEPWPFYGCLRPPANEGLETFLRTRYVRYRRINLKPAAWIPGDMHSVSIVHLVDKLDLQGAVVFDNNWAWLDVNYAVTAAAAGNKDLTYKDMELTPGHRVAIEKEYGSWAAARLDELASLLTYWPNGLQQICLEFQRKRVDIRKAKPQLIVFPARPSLNGRYTDFYSPQL